ncbi:MAG: thiamine diphosphokinase [Bacteroidales bacterium]|nr:thiamine diphosphokinase [Bacteroidales bacterium]
MKPENKIIVLANGNFPSSAHCRLMLDQAEKIICCDEAADNLLYYGKEPDLIIGDMDSISRVTVVKYKDRMVKLTEQETNDLTKAVNYCIDKGYSEVTILGATGLREDHTLGNISLLLEYNKRISARMVTDFGEFSMIKSGEEVRSFPGERISFFSVDNKVKVISEGLKYKLDNMQLHNWWRASLNEVTGESFTLHFESEWPLILFRAR